MDGVDGADVGLVEVLVVGYDVGLVEVGDDGADVEGMDGLTVGGRDGNPTILAGLLVGMGLG